MEPTLAQRLALRERPIGRPVMRQTWCNLLFLHWRYEAAEVQQSLPIGLTVDTFDGDAWVGIVPFFMRGVRPVGVPGIPFLSNFLELNVRTYVHDGRGNPGVWFFSLDASSSLAVAVARKMFHLPYFKATMTARATPATVDYWSQRKGLEPDHFAWQVGGSESLALPGSFEFFLIERYLLFSQNPVSKTFHTGLVHHSPYKLRAAKVLQYGTELLTPACLSQPERTFDHAAHVSKVQVEIFALRPK